MTDRIITYTVEDAAAYAHCHKQQILADIRKGKLPAKKIGRRWVILHEPYSRKRLISNVPEWRNW